MKTSPIQVTYIDKLGSDLSVVNAARVSFEKTSTLDESGNLKPEDAKLIRYLAKHQHWSPLAHTSLQIRVKAPIFVARQLVKHTVGLVWNEVSRRYVDSTPEFYIPSRWRRRNEDKKQGSHEDQFVDLSYSEELTINAIMDSALDMYKGLLEIGVCAEQARMILPQNTMTEWYWSGSLHAFARVCNLRCKKDTQKETRDVANQIDKIAEKHFPVSWKYLRSH
jgi:thymidylate synthase (FAD)